MGFRTLEISHAAEIHIKEGQLEIATGDGTVYIPIEDLNPIKTHACTGKYIRYNMICIIGNRQWNSKLRVSEAVVTLFILYIAQNIYNN